MSQSQLKNSSIKKLKESLLKVKEEDDVIEHTAVIDEIENPAVSKKVKICKDPVGTAPIAIALNDSDDDIPDLDSDSSDDESKDIRSSSFEKNKCIVKPLLQILSNGMEKCSLHNDSSNEVKHIPVLGHVVEKEVQLSNKRKLGDYNEKKTEVDSKESWILKKEEDFKMKRKESYKNKKQKSMAMRREIDSNIRNNEYNMTRVSSTTTSANTHIPMSSSSSVVKSKISNVSVQRENLYEERNTAKQYQGQNISVDSVENMILKRREAHNNKRKEYRKKKKEATTGQCIYNLQI